MKYKGLTRYYDTSCMDGFGGRPTYLCKYGHGFDEPGYKVTSRQTWWSPEEGDEFCPECGTMDFWENEGPFTFKGVRKCKKL